MNNKIPVCHNMTEVKEALNKNPDSKFCLYLALKTVEEWDKSTSRIYMNQIDKQIVYLPVNIKKDDKQMLEKIYKLSEEWTQIVAVNQTQPHKSNLVLQEWFKGRNLPINIDVLIKDRRGRLQPYDLNGPSFIDWFESEVGHFNNKKIIILGVGGVGEPIARNISSKKPKNLFLVDIISKASLADKLSNLISASYIPCLDKIPPLSDSIVFINCAGKEGASETGIIKFLETYKNNENTFIDLRPQLYIDIVKKARLLGWKSYTGFGMNARNDYSLLLRICASAEIVPPSFEDFKKLVAAAS